MCLCKIAAPPRTGRSSTSVLRSTAASTRTRNIKDLSLMRKIAPMRGNNNPILNILSITRDSCSWPHNNVR